MARLIFKTDHDSMKSVAILAVVICILFSTIAVAGADTPLAREIFKYKLKKILTAPGHFCVEIIATIEVLWNLGAIRHSEMRYLAFEGEYVSDGLPWGAHFTKLDVDPNRSPRRKWDYRVIAKGGHFRGDAQRRSGRYKGKTASLTDGSQWGGDYPFWLYRMIKKWFGQ